MEDYSCSHPDRGGNKLIEFIWISNAIDSCCSLSNNFGNDFVIYKLFILNNSDTLHRFVNTKYLQGHVISEVKLVCSG